MIQSIIEKYGFEAMREKWIEELLELATILQQSKSKDIDEFKIINELADVIFISEQMRHILGENAVDRQLKYKKQRTKERLGL